MPANLCGMKRGGALLLISAVFAAGATNPVMAETTDCISGFTPTHVGTPGDDVIRGTSETDFIVGLGGKDVIDGGGGVDLLCGGPDADRIDGGPGMDLIITGEGADKATGGPSFDVLAEFESSSATLFGLQAEMTDSSTDRLDGGAGIDLLVPEGGDDIVIGGPGQDFYEAAFSWSPTVIDLERDMAYSERGGTDSVLETEHAIGGVFADVLIGDDRSNLLWGYAGQDHIDGRGGSDLLYSDLDGQRLIGGDDQSSDMVAIAWNEAVRIDLLSGTVKSLDYDDHPIDVLVGIENAAGSPRADELIGSPSHNTLFGMGGADLVTGGAGDDDLVGDGPIVLPAFGKQEFHDRAGNDDLDGGDGKDRLDGGPKKDRCVNGETVRSCESGQDAPDEFDRGERFKLPWWIDLLPDFLGVRQLPLHPYERI